jgi:heme-degrading monooxygenase HmoA
MDTSKSKDTSSFGSKSHQRFGEPGQVVQMISANISDPGKIAQIRLPQPGNIEGLNAVQHLRSGNKFVALQTWESEQALQDAKSSSSYQHQLDQMRQSLGENLQTETYHVEDSYPTTSRS